MKKGALAAGALTLGGAGFGTATAGAQEQQIAVFAFKYHPGTDFTVVDQLQTSTTIEVLQEEGETVPEISQPDEWTGHIIRYEVGQDAGITTFLFTRGGGISVGEGGTLGTDASMLSGRLNLLNTSLESGDIEEDAETDGGDDAETDDGDNVTDDGDNVTDDADTNETGGD